MKTRLLLLSGLLFSGLCFAQTAIPNGNLESWKDTSFVNGGVTVKYSEPTGGMLKSLNKITQFPGPPPVTLFKDSTSVHAGNYAAKVVSGQVNFLGSNIFIPGALGTLDPFFGATNFGAKIGVPFTEKPAKFIGWFRYLSVQGDSAEFSAATVRTVAGVRETLSLAKQVVKFSESNWAYFEVDFVDLNAGTPDSLIVLCVSSAGYDFVDLTNCQGKLGSTLFIDDIALIYTGGLEEGLMGNAAVKVFPNPASDLIQINYEGASLNGSIRFIDAAGRVAHTQPFIGNNQSLSVSGLAKGMYSIVLIEGNKIVARQSFIKQ